MQFTQGLHRAVQRTPDAVATLFDDRETTFRQLRDRVARLVAGLRAMGVRDGDRLGMLGLNSDHYLAYYLAVPWAGAVVNPVNFCWSVEQICYSLKVSETVALFIHDKFTGQVDALLDGCPYLRMLIFTGDGECPPEAMPIDRLIADNEPMPDAGLGGEDLFGIFYTGGTTGQPKGVMLSHSNVCSSGLGLLVEGALPEGSVGLQTAPMFHLADVILVTCQVTRGGIPVMLAEFRPDRVFEVIGRHRISDLLLVPSTLQALVVHAEQAEVDTECVQRIMCGPSPASEALLDRSMATFPNADLMQVYGLTEMSAIITFLPPAAHGAAGREHGLLRSGGCSALHVQVRIVDGDGNELPRGEAGEVISARAERDAGLSQPVRRHRRGVAERLDAHRRRRLHERQRLRLRGGPVQGEDHLRRRERVLGRGRECGGPSTLPSLPARARCSRTSSVNRTGAMPGARSLRRRNQTGCDAPTLRHIFRSFSSHRHHYAPQTSGKYASKWERLAPFIPTAQAPRSAEIRESPGGKVPPASVTCSA